MHAETIKKILDSFEQHNPNPTTELYSINNYTALVAIMLSAQTTDKQVNKVTETLFKTLKSPEDAIAIGEEDLGKGISSIGLWRSKASNIVKMSHILVNDFNSEVPKKLEDLLLLPGVGRKSANAFLVNIYDSSAMPVDTHVFRTSNRIGLIKTTNTLDTERQLLKIIPKDKLSKTHHWLVLHGRYVCKARKPLCEQCIISDYCEFFKQMKNS